MPYPAKLVHIMGLLAKEETTYGTAVTLAAATDGVQLQYPDKNVGVIGELSYAYDGDFGPSISELGRIKRAAQSGRSFRAAYPARWKGGGAAYSATVVPSLHKLFKAAGLTATLDATVSAEKWTYTPTAAATAPTSLTMEAYGRGEKWPVAGGIGDFGFSADGAAPPIWTFDMFGIATLPSDVAVPAITYPLTGVVPPLASSVTFVLGNFTSNAVLLSGSFKQGREVEPGARVAISAAGAHLGFVAGGRKPVVTIVVEATALQTTPFHAAGGIDPYQLREMGQNFLFSLLFGSVQYNKIKLNLPQAQVIGVRPGNKGATATWELDIAAYNSTPAATDDFSIICD